MNAIILADFGPMITPLTDDCPKSMLKIANVPLLDYSFSQLNYYGLKDITFVSAIKNDKAMNYIASYKGLNCRFYDKACSDFGLEKLKAEFNYWDDISVVIKCDSVNDIDLFKLIYTHLESGAEITMAVVPQKNEDTNCAVLIDADNSVYAFSDRFSVFVKETMADAGVYVINKSVIKNSLEAGKFDFTREFLAEYSRKHTLKAFVHNGSYCEIKDKDSFFKANFFLKDGGFFPEISSYEREAYGSESKGGSLVSKGAVTVGGFRDCIVGKGARIASCARISDCVVLDDALVTGVHSYAVIGPNFVENIASPATKPALSGDFYDNLLQSGI